MILHKLNHSPFGGNSLTQCLSFANENDALLLTEDAVYALCNTDARFPELIARKSLYALEEDLKARGVDNTLSNCKTINYEDMVELCLSCSHVMSW